MKKISCLIVALPVFCLFCFSDVHAQSSGGGYALSQTVIAAGGGTSSDAVNNNYKIEGTSGQSTAGTSGGGAYFARGGFWTPAPLAPTAGGVNIAGRVIGTGGAGLRNVSVTLSGGSLLVPRKARTGSLGYFSFEDVEAGQIYIISVQNTKYGFAPESQVISLVDNVTDIVFQASWVN